MSNLKPWDELHKNYSQTDWIDKPNIFAEQILEYLPSEGKLLDIGAGQGQDSRFFLTKGFEVTSLDISDKALEEARAKIPTENAESLHIVQADISQELPFDNEAFDVVYAHLSLHYFDTPATDKILQEINRVLKPSGIIAFFTNSTLDPEFGQGEKLEDELFLIEGKTKRYFSVESARKFAGKYFEEIMADNHGETYKDTEKGISNLIRYVGKKHEQ